MVAVNKKTAGEIKAQHDAIEELTVLAMEAYVDAVKFRGDTRGINYLPLLSMVDAGVRRICVQIVEQFSISDLDWPSLCLAVKKEAGESGLQVCEAIDEACSNLSVKPTV